MKSSQLPQLATHIQRTYTKYVKTSKMRQTDWKSKSHHNRETPYSQYGSVQQDAPGVEGDYAIQGFVVMLMHVNYVPNCQAGL